MREARPISNPRLTARSEGADVVRMAARWLLALLISLLAGLFLGSPAYAGHAHHGGGASAAHHPGHERPANDGCCAAEGAHCASPIGIVALPATRRPADERMTDAASPDLDSPSARFPDPLPKPPRA
jgi:hypothetical protein